VIVVGRKHLEASAQQQPSVHDWLENLWQNFAYKPRSNLCGIAGMSLPLSQQDKSRPH
jgi:amidase